MAGPALHRYERDGRRYAVDPETCFCFECDAVSWDVLEHYPHATLNRILHLLQDRHPEKEILEVAGELEWLRAAKSIFTVPKQEDYAKRFEIERGLKRMTVLCAGSAQTQASRRWFARRGDNSANRGGEDAVSDRLLAAAQLLLARSGKQRELRLECVWPRPPADPAVITACCRKVRALARLADKEVRISIMIDPLPASADVFRGHDLAASLEISGDIGDDAADALRQFLRAAARGPEAAAKAAPDPPGMGIRIVIRPGHPDFAGVVQACRAAGVGHIELDLEGAYVAHPALDPAAMAKTLEAVALDYAEELVQGRYWRLEPVAGLFARIYHGTPQARTDDAGTYALAVAEDGGIYPGRHFIPWDAFRAGALDEATIVEAALRRFDDAGALTTRPCLRCWARNLCGGGAAAVHQALSGSFRAPHPPWCDAQRGWMEAAIAAFNRLASEGVNFARIHEAMRPAKRPGLLAMVRAAFRMHIGLRPIEEADAPLLAKWENWNDAAYFTFNEHGLLMASQYDREMDALHPLGIEQEFLLLRRKGDPFGLLKIRPEAMPGVAMAWIYFRNPRDYAEEKVRTSFRYMLREALARQGIQRILIPAGPGEHALADFLAAVGFAPCATLREALYLHGAYHDMCLFSFMFDEEKMAPR